MNVPLQQPIRYLSKIEAQPLWKKLCSDNDLRLTSITYKCMFEKTKSSRGNQSQFGLTPLWDNELRKNSGGVVFYSEFMDLAQKLIDSGKTRQGR
jgi:hypothetical protein